MQAHHVIHHYGIVFKFQKMRFCVYTAFIDEDAMPSTYILSIHTCWGSGNVSETHIYRHHTHTHNVYDRETYLCRHMRFFMTIYHMHLI